MRLGFARSARWNRRRRPRRTRWRVRRPPPGASLSSFDLFLELPVDLLSVFFFVERLFEEDLHRAIDVITKDSGDRLQRLCRGAVERWREIRLRNVHVLVDEIAGFADVFPDVGVLQEL